MCFLILIPLFLFVLSTFGVFIIYALYMGLAPKKFERKKLRDKKFSTFRGSENFN